MSLRSAAVVISSIALGTGLPLLGCKSENTAPNGNYSSHGIRETGLSADAKAAIESLTANNKGASTMAPYAKGILVFPKVVKGGFIVGAFHGEGVMVKNGATSGYYNTSGGSYGLQAGLQSYSYALFFMDDADLSYLENSSGWEIGVGPNITIVDEGMAGSLTTTSARKGVYCFFFDQKGLMAGMGLQGSKITRIDR